MDDLRRELSRYRFERAWKECREARECFVRESFHRAVTSAYYAMFHAVRAILALEGFDAKKHVSVIGYFNKN